MVVLGEVTLVAALQPDDGGPTPATSARVLAEALVAAAPARVAGDAEARREVPRDAGGAHLLGGDPADLLDQRRVAGGAEPDVVREDRRADHIAVTVHGVHAVDDRDAAAGCVSACRWKPSTMSAQAAGVFGVGTDPPPDSTEPRPIR